MKKKVIFEVSGMKCGSCEKSIHQHFSSKPGHPIPSISLEEKTLSLTIDPKQISPLLIKKEIENLGFQVVKLSIQ